jgi:hypothetical protein
MLQLPIKEEVVKGNLNLVIIRVILAQGIKVDQVLQK